MKSAACNASLLHASMHIMLLVSARFDNVDPATGARLQTLLQRDWPRGAPAGLTTQEGAGEPSNMPQQEQQQDQQQLSSTTGAKQSAGDVQRAKERGKPAGKKGKASGAPAQALAQDAGQATQLQPEPESGAPPHAETSQLSQNGAREAGAAGGHAARAPRRAHHVEAEASSNEAGVPAEERIHDQQGCLLHIGSALAGGVETGPDAEQGLEPRPGAEPGAKPGIRLRTAERWPGPGPQPMGDSEAEPSAERCRGAEPQLKDEGPAASSGPQGAAESNGAAQEQRQEEPLLFCLPQLGMWTKLRPFVRAFLDQVCGLYGLPVTADLLLQAGDAASIEWHNRCLHNEAMLPWTPTLAL